MPFNLLLLSSLKYQTSFSDRGHSVSLKPKNNEKVLFFDIDRDDCALQQALLEQSPDHKICDGLILYQTASKKIVCLVELKGKEINHAVKQILNTYHFFKPFLDKSLSKTNVGRNLKQQLEWRAYICQRRGSSAPTKKSNKGKLNKAIQHQKQLNKIFSRYDVSKNTDIGTFLRT